MATKIAVGCATLSLDARITKILTDIHFSIFIKKSCIFDRHNLTVRGSIQNTFMSL